MGGYAKHQERLDALNALGRQLARRARSKCEVCEAAQVPLAPYEVPPVPKAPDVDQTLFICQTCREGLEGGALDPNHWRLVETAIWNDFSPIKVCAYRITARLHNDGVAWATELLDMAYLTDEERQWVESDT